MTITCKLLLHQGNRIQTEHADAERVLLIGKLKALLHAGYSRIADAVAILESSQLSSCWGCD